MERLFMIRARVVHEFTLGKFDSIDSFVHKTLSVLIVNLMSVFTVIY